MFFIRVAEVLWMTRNSRNRSPDQSHVISRVEEVAMALSANFIWYCFFFRWSWITEPIFVFFLCAESQNEYYWAAPQPFEMFVKPSLNLFNWNWNLIPMTVLNETNSFAYDLWSNLFQNPINLQQYRFSLIWSTSPSWNIAHHSLHQPTHRQKPGAGFWHEGPA